MLSKVPFEKMQSMSGISAISGINQEEGMFIDEESREEIAYTIKVNAPQSNSQNSKILKGKMEKVSLQEEVKVNNAKSVLTVETTGYDIMRDVYSEEQISEAFNIIDINKDGWISFEDLDFFLDCLNEPHTSEEINEMISMISSDKHRVAFEDFKKIGKGKIIPFAAIKIPESESKNRQNILETIKCSKLGSNDPEQINLDSYELISHDKFLEERSEKNVKSSKDVKEMRKEEENIDSILFLRTSEQLKNRREDMRRISMLNIDSIIDNYVHHHSVFLQNNQIAQMLSISQQQAKMLFQNYPKPISSKAVLMEAIFFSNKGIMSKLELILSWFSKGSTISIREWVHILSFLLGKDKQETVKRKLRAVLKDRRVSQEVQFDKYFVLQVMSGQTMLFAI